MKVYVNTRISVFFICVKRGRKLGNCCEHATVCYYSYLFLFLFVKTKTLHLRTE